MSSRETETQSTWCKNCKNVTAFVVQKIFLRSFTGQNVQSPDGKDAEIYAQTSQWPKDSYGKGSKYRQNTEAGPSSSQGGKKGHCEISPKFPMLTSLHSVESVNAFASTTSGRKIPPFFIVQGKKVMTRWFDSLPAESYRAHVLTENNWFPPNRVVKNVWKRVYDKRHNPIFYLASG